MRDAIWKENDLVMLIIPLRIIENNNTLRIIKGRRHFYYGKKTYKKAKEKPKLNKNPQSEKAEKDSTFEETNQKKGTWNISRVR